MIWLFFNMHCISRYPFEWYELFIIIWNIHQLMETTLLLAISIWLNSEYCQVSWSNQNSYRKFLEALKIKKMWILSSASPSRQSQLLPQLQLARRQSPQQPRQRQQNQPQRPLRVPPPLKPQPLRKNQLSQHRSPHRR